MANMFNNGNNNYNASSSQFSGTQIGGGYMTNNNNENFNSSNYGGGGQSNMVSYEERTLAQVTIKQIITAPPPQQDEGLMIDGQRISQIQLIGQIEEINVQNSHTAIKINDNTGSIDVKQWSNESNGADTHNLDLSQGTYVKVIGRTNIFNGKVSINAFKILPIEDFNEVAYHFTECIFAHLMNTKAQQTKFNPNMGGGNTMSYNQTNNNMQNMNNNNNNTNDHNMGSFGGDGDDEFTPLQKKVAAVMRRCPNQEGINVSVIFKHLPHDDVNEIREAIDDLSDKGFCYSSIDEDHYALSENKN